MLGKCNGHKRSWTSIEHVAPRSVLTSTNAAQIQVEAWRQAQAPIPPVDVAIKESVAQAWQHWTCLLIRQVSREVFIGISYNIFLYCSTIVALYFALSFALCILRITLIRHAEFRALQLADDCDGVLEVLWQTQRHYRQDGDNFVLKSLTSSFML